MLQERAIDKKNDKMEGYKKNIGKKFNIFLFSLAMLFILSIIAINAGSTNLNFKEIFMTIIGQGTEISNIVVWNIRLPRILSAIIVGGGLSVAGCVMQNNLRNSIASQLTLGLANAAAFGANIAIILLGAGSIQSSSADAVVINNPYMVAIAACISCIVAMIVILMIAKLKGFMPESIILVGVSLNFLFLAGITLIQYFAEDVQVAAAVFWTFGDLGRTAWKEVGIMAVITSISLIYFMFRRWDYNVLDSGEESAKSLGVNVERVRLGGMLVSCIVTAVAVAFVGIIGFVGLISPQIARKIIGGDYRFLIPTSALMGALTLIIADTIARTIIAPIILPVGAITSLIGAPLFLGLLLRGYKR